MGWKAGELGPKWQIIPYIGGEMNGKKLWTNTDKPGVTTLVPMTPRDEKTGAVEQAYSVFYSRENSRYEAHLIMEKYKGRQ